MEPRSQLLARRKRKRRRQHDRPPISAHLLLDERMKDDVGILSVDLLQDLFPGYRKSDCEYRDHVAIGVEGSQLTACTYSFSGRESHTSCSHCAMAANLCSFNPQYHLDHSACSSSVQTRLTSPAAHIVYTVPGIITWTAVVSPNSPDRFSRKSLSTQRHSHRD